MDKDTAGESRRAWMCYCHHWQKLTQQRRAKVRQVYPVFTHNDTLITPTGAQWNSSSCSHGNRWTWRTAAVRQGWGRHPLVQTRNYSRAASFSLLLCFCMMQINDFHQHGCVLINSRGSSAVGLASFIPRHTCFIMSVSCISITLTCSI